ncbi:amino acid adenylation domain-containing protein [Streptomyces daliensis]|uniref:Amino acid adenylation domain-containing protein n=1 Tax=Streptomyces daliensis TaxID=299421 RepID=A0A8T4IW71_9ACTN|nr:amino acid adenylation domain-containing protein [Streptomyces daliensis]
MAHTQTGTATASAGGAAAPLVHDLVRRTALTHPGRTAVTDTDGSALSYGELAERTRRLAHVLRGHGVGPDVPVPVRLTRSADVVVAMLAAFEAGGAYAPVDPAWPTARMALVLEKLGATVCVTDGEPAREYGVDGVLAVPPGGHPAAPETGEAPEESAPPASPALHPDHLAYVLHTSGSTGTPKSVAMTHRGLSRLIGWQTASGPTGLTTLNFTAMGFDVTFQEVLSTLATGGRLCLVAEEVRRDPERLLATLDTQSIERIFLPYVALQQLAKAAERTGRVPRSLRHVVTAGERLVVTEAIAGLFARLPGCRLDNHYGPTEAHLVTSHTLRAEDTPWPELPPIGTAVTGATAHVLDASLAPVPPGEEGELFVGGPAVARGYLRQPALTAERFLPDPFAAHSGARMYRTGDLVRRDADGTVHFVGRTDTQIKVRGYRVEPAEVETVLAKHPGVREVAVGLRTLVDDVAGLVAYVVPEASGVPAVGELLDHARGTLPDYMVPSRFVFLPSLPLTATGKVDQRALLDTALPAGPGQGTADAEGGEDSEGGEESLTATVLRLWRRVLGHDEFDEDDDFFDVGGDSLLATWVVAELGHTLGREVELALLLEESTVAGLAQALARSEAEGEGAPSVRRTGSEVRTLSPGPSGRALFLFHALGGELFAYRELARALTSPLRVLGVRLTGERVPLSVPETARMHMEQIRIVQPEGPYLLAGWSYGGVLAFETARQLTAAGERVEFLGLVDANPLRDPITGLAPAQTPHLPLLTRVLEGIEKEGAGTNGAAVGERGGSGNGLLGVEHLATEEEWTSLMGTSAAATGLSARHLKHQLETASDSMRAAIAYAPEPYAGDAVLFQAEATGTDMRRQLAADLGGLIGGNLRVLPVPGDHNGMLTAPDVDRLAAAMDEAIEHSREEATHGS